MEQSAVMAVKVSLGEASERTKIILAASAKSARSAKITGISVGIAD